MSDLAATGCCNDCGCGGLSGNNNRMGCSWIIILLLIFCCGNNDNGFGFGNRCDNDNCGCNWIWIIILLCCCGGWN